MSQKRRLNIWAYLERPYGWILGLAIACGLVYVTLVFDSFPITLPTASRNEAIAVFRGLSVTLFGSYLVAVLVNRTFRRIQEEERQRKLQLALQELQEPINQQLTLLGNWYVAAADREQTPPPDSYREFLTSDYTDTIRWLDLSKEYPTAGAHTTSWFEYSGGMMAQSQEGIETVISTYGSVMSPELMRDLHRLASSDLSEMVQSFGDGRLMQIDAQNGYKRDYMLFAGQGVDSAIQSHVDALLAVLSYFEEPDNPELTPISNQGFWRDDVSPKIGSARGEIHPDEADPKFGMGEGPPPEEGIN
ncbi:hypothetical protein ACFQL9_13250 [Halobaculum lipolyticum]|uniref:Uncharacterized protein n=1 Tax=Halobaculum lipolyticum TaxID=3032001 RepID=A0ABD5WIL0_9EURY